MTNTGHDPSLTGQCLGGRFGYGKTRMPEMWGEAFLHQSAMRLQHFRARGLPLVNHDKLAATTLDEKQISEGIRRTHDSLSWLATLLAERWRIATPSQVLLSTHWRARGTGRSRWDASIGAYASLAPPHRWAGRGACLDPPGATLPREDLGV